MIHPDFIKLLKKLAPFSEEEMESAGSFFDIEEVKKNEYFLRAGHESGKIGFVVSGILRTFYVVDRREITTDFLLPGSIAAGMLSFLSDEPQNANIIALEDTVLTTITKENLADLYSEHWKWQQVGRLLIEHNYVKIGDRSICLQTLTARGRYEDLMRKMPGLVDQVPLQYIASYLGMSPETFSRIRSK